MRVTANDNDRVLTHDDASALLRYAVPGAQVEIYQRRLQRWDERVLDRSRQYTITVRGHGCDDVAVLGSYSLPAPAKQLVESARKQVESALAARKGLEWTSN